MRLFAPRYWPTWAGIGLLRLLALLPFRRCWRAGSHSAVCCASGDAVSCAPHAATRAVFSGARQPRRANGSSTDHFKSLGIALLEVPLAWWSPRNASARLARVEGTEHLEAAAGARQGVLLLTAHFTTMEMAGRVLASVAPVSFLYRPTRTRYWRTRSERFRTGTAAAPFPADDIRAFIAALRRTSASGMRRTRATAKRGRRWCACLASRPRPTPSLRAWRASPGAAVLPYFLAACPERGLRATIHPPLEDFPSEVRWRTPTLQPMIEAQVRHAPEQYLWIHRRFKGLTEDYPDYYAREGRAP